MATAVRQKVSKRALVHRSGLTRTAAKRGLGMTLRTREWLGKSACGRRRCSRRVALPGDVVTLQCASEGLDINTLGFAFTYFHFGPTDDLAQGHCQHWRIWMRRRHGHWQESCGRNLGWGEAWARLPVKHRLFATAPADARKSTCELGRGPFPAPTTIANQHTCGAEHHNSASAQRRLVAGSESRANGPHRRVGDLVTVESPETDRRDSRTDPCPVRSRG